MIRGRRHVLLLEESELVSNQLEVLGHRDGAIILRSSLDVEGEEAVDAVDGGDVSHRRHGMLSSVHLEDSS